MTGIDRIIFNGNVRGIGSGPIIHGPDAGPGDSPGGVIDREALNRHVIRAFDINRIGGLVAVVVDYDSRVCLKNDGLPGKSGLGHGKVQTEAVVSAGTHRDGVSSHHHQGGLTQSGEWSSVGAGIAVAAARRDEVTIECDTRFELFKEELRFSLNSH